MSDETKPQPEWGIKLSAYICIPQRVIMSFLAFFGCVNCYAMRICLSMAMPALVIPRNYSNENLSEHHHCPPSEHLFENDSPPESGEHEWSQSLQGFILSCFYIGYLITHLPGGELSRMFGGKWVFNICVLVSSVCSLLTPMAIDYTEHYGLIALRMVMGLAQGILFPATTALLSQWVPIRERSSTGTIVFSGTQLGTIVANISTGYLISHYSWPVIFYVLGVSGLIWFIFFTIFCTSYPAIHPCIKPREKEYLLTELTGVTAKKDLGVTPWKEMLTSVPVYMMIAAQVGHDWAFYIMVTDLPKYLNDVLQIPIMQNAVFSSMPFAMMLLMSVISSIIADILIIHNFPVTPIRKVLTILAAIVSVIFFMLASYAGCREFIVLTSFTLCVGGMGIFYPGARLTTIDLSPNNAGTLMALSNGLGSLTGFIAPLSVGLMTPNTTMQEWRGVFWVASTILLASAVMYCIWGTSELQSWNEPKPKKPE